MGKALKNCKEVSYFEAVPKEHCTGDFSEMEGL